MFEHFTQLLQNQFLSGGLVMMLAGSLIAMARNVPFRLWTWFKSQFIVEVRVRNNDPLFYWVCLWLNDHPYSKRVRRLSATTRAEGLNSTCAVAAPATDGEEEQLPEIILTPAKGQHFFVYKKKLIWLSRDEQSASGPSSKSSSWQMKEENFEVRMLGRSQATIRELLQEVSNHAHRLTQKKVAAYVSGWDYWSLANSFQPRPLESVILPDDTISAIRGDMEGFLQRRDWYVQIGIPYRRGYLLYGVPGSGKTSLISALAGSLRLNLYVLSLTGDRMDDERLNQLLKNVPSRSLLLLEDIDAVTKSRAITAAKEGESGGGVTLTGLLNALDGVLSSEGVITIMTTNYRERLDPALIRPGRVDMQVEFTYATEQQIATLCQRFFPDDHPRAQEIANSFTPQITMADVQCRLLREVEAVR